MSGWMSPAKLVDDHRMMSESRRCGADGIDCERLASIGPRGVVHRAGDDVVSGWAWSVKRALDAMLHKRVTQRKRVRRFELPCCVIRDFIEVNTRILAYANIPRGGTRARVRGRQMSFALRAVFLVVGKLAGGVLLHVAKETFGRDRPIRRHVDFNDRQ